MQNVAYIHGLNSTGLTFNFIRSQLPKHNAIPIAYDTCQSVEESFLDALDQLPARKQVHLVCHSLGGIVGFLLATRALSSGKIASLTTISTPFSGSKFASRLRWFYPNYGVLKDLAPNSKIMNEIKLLNKPSCPFMSFVSVGGGVPLINEPNDSIVTIASQKSIVADTQIDVPTNHFEIVQDHSVTRKIQNFIFKD